MKKKLFYLIHILVKFGDELMQEQERISSKKCFILCFEARGRGTHLHAQFLKDDLHIHKNMLINFRHSRDIISEINYFLVLHSNSCRTWAEPEEGPGGDTSYTNHIYILRLLVML